jgi:hypothetical protein
MKRISLALAALLFSTQAFAQTQFPPSTLWGNAKTSKASPTTVTVPSCPAGALNFTPGTGFGCGTLSGSGVTSLGGMTGVITCGSNLTCAAGTISATGGGSPGGSNLQIQYNNAGSFGGLTDSQVTARIQSFTSTLSGAAPASGGGTTAFLRADGTWAIPSGTGSGVTSLGGMTGVITCGANMTCTGGQINSTGGSTPALAHTHLFVGNGSNAAADFGTLATFADTGGLTIAPTSGTTSPGLTINQTGPNTGSQGTSQISYNSIVVNDGARPSNGQYSIGLLVQQNLLSNILGQKTPLYVASVRNTGNTLTPNDQIGFVSFTQVGVTNGGTGTGDPNATGCSAVPPTGASCPLGGVYALNPIISVSAGATNYDTFAVGEFDMQMGGGSVRNRFGLNVVNADVGTGAFRDAAVAIESSNITGSWRIAMLFSNRVSAQALASTGSIIASDGYAQTIASVISLPNWTINGNIFDFTAAGYKVSGVGVVTSAGLTLSNVTGSTQCLHANASGVVTGTGADCGSGTGGVSLSSPNTWTATQTFQVAAQSPVVIAGTSGSNTVALLNTNAGTSATWAFEDAGIAKWYLGKQTDNSFVVTDGQTGHTILSSLLGSDAVRLGNVGANGGVLKFVGATSGNVTVQPQAAAGTPTLTLPTTTGTFAVSASSPLVLDAATGILTCPTCGGGVSVSSPNTWTALQTHTAGVTTNTLTVTALAGTGTRCVHTDLSGVLSATSSDCGSASGGGVTSVGNADGSLTVTNGATTPDVKIAVGHANTWTATQSMSGLTLSSITGSTQCLQVDTSGNVSGYGVSCLGGYSGGASTPFTTTVTNSSGAYGGTTSTSSYIKVGKFVYVQIAVSVTAAGTAGGSPIFSLPSGLNCKAGSFVVGREDGISGKMLSGVCQATQLGIVDYTNTPPTNATGAHYTLSGSYETP